MEVTGILFSCLIGLILILLYKLYLFISTIRQTYQLFKDAPGPKKPKPRALGSGYRELLPWIGEGLLVANGNRWSRSRRLLTPAFHFDILKPYTTVYNESAEQLIEQVSKYADTGESFELFQVISSCTLDVILRCAFSYNSGCQQSGNLLMANDFAFNLTRKGKQFRQHCKYVHDVAEEIINKRRKELNEKGVPTRRYLDFLDILLTAKDNDGIGLTNLEIRNEVDTFLFEGHDTTASGISWILYHLAKHPEHQQKCQDEIDEVDDLTKLEYLSMCLKEGMRLSAPVPGISRQLSQEVEIDGKKLTAGTVIIPFMHLLHLNPKIWNDPLKFDPLRFSKENIKVMDPNCIGQVFALNEEKVVLARFLQRFKLELDTKHILMKEFALISRSENGIRILIKERRG
ncbi:hypothetical protein KUTeg_002317 [Tegillarca granosa]|uniref:Uncharacterized protein n=1 Tax=Tegillarca granosa TaxID=220873 RepID=A0ABQ9FYC4_TEGGR|nr:hypothetical protein KUTeg_002317 [Tegillarca granosa]